MELCSRCDLHAQQIPITILLLSLSNVMVKKGIWFVNNQGGDLHSRCNLHAQKFDINHSIVMPFKCYCQDTICIGHCFDL